MIEYKQGSIFLEDADVLVNPVNTVGVMGKGLALRFKARYPDNYNAYKKHCIRNRDTIKVGDVYLYHSKGDQFIANVATKKHWKNLSVLSDINIGLQNLIKVMNENKFNTMLLPALGCGCGCLSWSVVKPLFDYYFKNSSLKVIAFEPKKNDR